MARFEPPASEVSAPFWDATRERRLVLQWCRACDEPIHYPREVCPNCLGADLEWRPASGRGEVYARTAIPREDGSTNVVALVTLDEGARLMSNVIGCEAEAVHVGLPVQVTWEELSDGRHLPLFEPREG